MADTMELLVRQQGQGRQVAALCQGKLLEFIQEEGDADSWVGAVVLGTVERVLPALGAAFVKIGLPLNGFLPLTEQESFDAGGKQPLLSGQEVLVQVKKDPLGEKGAFLTRDIALPGQYALYMPHNRHIGVSARIPQGEQREWALALGEALGGGEAGVIVRHGALTARAQDIESEWAALGEAWRAILEKARFHKPPAVLFREDSALRGLVRDYGARYRLRLTAQEERMLEGLPLPQEDMRLAGPVEMEALWQGMGVEGQLREALERKISLPGGGTLVIDEREALTTVDVNTAHFTGAPLKGRGPAVPSVALAQNLAACPQIARQIRLRNLSGILLIDFIDMESDQEREQVQSALERELEDDRVKTVIHGFTRLGLLEMTRKRTRESLSQALAAREKGKGQARRGRGKDHQA